MRVSYAWRAAVVVGGALALCPTARSHDLPGAIHGGAVITNGVVKLGVDNSGNLNIFSEDDPGDYQTTSPFQVGVRYIKPGIGDLEYTSDGCTCEGWGCADAATGVTAFADDGAATTAKYGGYTFMSFSSTASTAQSVVESSDPGTVKFRVTHDYAPSAGSPNLYDCLVTIENIGTDPINDLRYRRVMDWDVNPTSFSEFVSILGLPPGGVPAGNVLFTSNNGFATGDPLSFVAPDDPLEDGNGLFGVPENQNFTDQGPFDHGALFDFAFGVLGVGEKRQFHIFYGGADTVADAEAAITAVGAQIGSVARPDLDSDDPLFSVAIFAFADVCNPPVITSFTATPNVLWSPNHKMVDITLAHTTDGGCGGVGEDDCEIISITSNEPVNDKGDGNTSPDWEFVDVNHVRLRAERAGPLTGRIYTITLKCTDAVGNETTAETIVTVPHSQKK